MTLSELYAHKSQFAARTVGNEKVLVPLKKSIAQMNSMYTLNEVGAFIWDSIYEQTTSDELVSAIVDEFEIDSETARRDVAQFIQNMQEILKQ